MNVDCGECPNVTSGCKDVCMKARSEPVTRHQSATQTPDVALRIQACRPEDRAMLQTEAGKELIKCTDLDRMVDAFLSWPLPSSVCSDACATHRDWSMPRTGTHLLDENEARQMLEHVLKVISPTVAGWKLVPMVPTEAMLDKGQHSNSEWLNDNAPIGESRYRNHAKSVYAAMLAAAPPHPTTQEKA